MINFNLKVVKAERSYGGHNLVKRDKDDFIIRLRNAYKKDSAGQANYKKLMKVAGFRGLENRTAGENGVIYVGDRSKIMEDLEAQIAVAKGDELDKLTAQKEFLGQFVDGRFWDITAKDMELAENLEMLLDLNTNGCL